MTPLFNNRKILWGKKTFFKWGNEIIETARNRDRETERQKDRKRDRERQKERQTDRQRHS